MVFCFAKMNESVRQLRSGYDMRRHGTHKRPQPTDTDSSFRTELILEQLQYSRLTLKSTGRLK